jgi:membrane-associated phospholipid phosphatase
VVILFGAGYFGLGLGIDPARARDLATALDARIPFVASSVWIYVAVFPAAFLPLFVVRCPRLFRRTIAAYGVAIAASLVVFAAFPVTSSGLRVNADALDPARLSQWGVALLYRLDPPYNLFPSLHLSMALLAGLAAWKASRRYGATALAGVALIGVSTLTVKQHFIADGVAGIALAAVVYTAIMRPYEPAPGTDPAYGRRGPAAFAVVLVVLYAAIIASRSMNSIR